MRDSDSGRGRHLPACMAALALLIAGIVATGGRTNAARATQAPRAAPGGEVRAVWVVRDDLTSAAAIHQIVENVRAAGLNTIFLQVRGRGDAWYQSSLEPRAEGLAGAPPDFDPLATAIQECRAAGIRLHAWLNAMYVWSDEHAPRAADHLVNAHPDWLSVDSAGHRLGPGSPGGVFLCPSNPAARQHLREVYVDVARRYEVDGIQMDYIRYPSARTCFCAGCQERFAGWLRARGKTVRPGLGTIRSYPVEWRAWRREQITSLVAAIRSDLRAVRPRLLLSADVVPWGSFSADFRETDAYNLCGQDWDGWIRAGLIDAAAPMTYTTSPAIFRGWVDGETRAHPGFPFWFGVGAYLCGPEAAVEKIRIARAAHAAGWSLFSYGAVTRGCGDTAYLRSVSARLGVRPLEAGSSPERREMPAAAVVTHLPTLPAAAPAGALITARDLARNLSEAGFQPQPLGETAYQVTLARDGWTYRVKVSLESAGRQLALITRLGGPAEPSRLPPGALDGLLAARKQARPARFLVATVDKEGRQMVYLRSAIGVDHITPALLRGEIERFCATVSGSYAAWKPWRMSQQVKPARVRRVH